MSDEQATEVQPELTPRQRVSVYLLTKLADDMATGTAKEQETAAMMRLASYAISNDLEAVVVKVFTAWANSLPEPEPEQRNDAGSDWVASWQRWNDEAEA